MEKATLNMEQTLLLADMGFTTDPDAAAVLTVDQDTLVIGTLAGEATTVVLHDGHVQDLKQSCFRQCRKCQSKR